MDTASLSRTLSKVKEVEYKKIPREIHLLTERDFYIWLDTEREAEEQLKKLKKANQTMLQV